MALFQIPQDLIPGTLKLLQLSEEEFQELKAAVENISPSPRQDRVIERIEQAVGRNPYILSSEDISSVLNSLFALRQTQINFDLSVEQLASELFLAVAEIDNELSFEDAQKHLFLQNLLSLFSSGGAISVSLTAGKMLTSYENVYSEAEIITDLRPVFSLEEPNQLAGTFVSHHLKVVYYHNQGAMSIYFDMDEVDLDELLEVLHTAKQKSQALKSTLRSTSIDLIE